LRAKAKDVKNKLVADVHEAKRLKLSTVAGEGTEGDPMDVERMEAGALGAAHHSLDLGGADNVVTREQVLRPPALPCCSVLPQAVVI
jgi:hypothetical protein